MAQVVSLARQIRAGNRFPQKTAIPNIIHIFSGLAKKFERPGRN
jgi:hypothetical protein